jgi:hypothetical protein
MFYHNTRHSFPLPKGSPKDVAGGIIAASAMPQPNLVRRAFAKAPYLKRRLLDPQLYLATLDKDNASNNVTKLGTYPWFRCAVESYKSGKAGGLPKWHADQSEALLKSWPGKVATDPAEIATCASSCVQLQEELECEAIILPAPMTRQPGGAYASEAAWIDAGIAAASERRSAKQLFATVAISDSALRELDPLKNPLLQAISAQIGSRDRLAGAYIVIAQDSEDPDSWVCRNPDTLLSLLVLVDDLVRGAGKEVFIGGVGTFGAVAAAAGARIWSTGYYRSQRRLRTSDFDDTNGRTVPRYFSLKLLSDIGVEHDLALLAKDPRTNGKGGDSVFTDTPITKELNRVLLGGGAPGDVPEWTYALGRPTAAMAHYNHCMQRISTALDLLEPEARLERMQLALTRAEKVAERVGEVVTARDRPDKQRTKHTDFGSQKIWRATFETWLNARRDD